MPTRPRTLGVLVLISIALFAAGFVLPDYWWQGPVSQAVYKPPVPGPKRTFYLAEQIRAVFQRAEHDAPALDLAARPTLIAVVLVLILFVTRLRRIAVFLGVLCIFGWLMRWIARAPHGFCAGYYAFMAGLVVLIAAAWLGRRPLGGKARCAVRLSLTLVALLIVAAVILHFAFEGPRNLAQYPPRESSPYLLPFRGGSTRICIQSNNGIYSHHKWQEFAYDFVMPIGTDVVAARDGVVSSIQVALDGHGNFNNDVVVEHGDGTWAQYLHLMKGGSYVRSGQKVKRGDLLGASGDVGVSAGPHMHFAVYHREATGRFVTIPVSFSDVPGDGVPRPLRRYTSGNRN